MLRKLAAASLLLASASMTGPAVASDGAVTISSGPKFTALVELFTSEGCSSCPPADRWLSKLVDDDRLWKSIVPIAFHVDYWDYIGWKDEFADAAFSLRQREHRTKGHVRSVYTPGFVVGGQEWRGWFSFPVLRVPSAPDPGSLSATHDQGQVDVRYTPTAVGRVPNPRIHVAVLGFDLVTEVKAGENHGRRLNHDFVVLGYASKALQGSADELTARLALPTPRFTAARTALAVWVSPHGDTRPVQAAGGWIDLGS